MTPKKTTVLHRPNDMYLDKCFFFKWKETQCMFWKRGRIGCIWCIYYLNILFRYRLSTESLYYRITGYLKQLHWFWGTNKGRVPLSKRNNCTLKSMFMNFTKKRDKARKLQYCKISTYRRLRLQTSTMIAAMTFTRKTPTIDIGKISWSEI